MQEHDVQRRSSDDAQMDDDHLRKLRELFEQNAGLITPGCRDTIDSILSTYGAVRDEVEQNPRIGLVLSAEFTATPTQQSSPAVIVSQADRNLHERSVDLAEDQNSHDRRGSHQNMAQDPMAEYADYLLQIGSSRSNDFGSFIDAESVAPKDEPDGYITQDTESTRHDQGHICLDIDHELDIGLFQYRDLLGHHNDQEQTVKSAGETDPELGKFQNQLSQTYVLVMSPVMQVAAFDPRSVVRNGRATTKSSTASSCNAHDLSRDAAFTREADWVHNVAWPVATQYTTVASASKSSANFHTTTGRGSSYISTKGPPHTGSIVPEDSASNIVTSTEHQAPYRKVTKTGMNPFFLGCNVDDLFEGITKRLQGDVKKWLKHIGDKGESGMGGKVYERKAPAPSFFAWVEQNVAAEHVLNASMAVVFAAVVASGQVFS